MLLAIFSLSYTATLVGAIGCIIHAIRNKTWTKLLLMIFVPFYLIYYIFKQEQTTEIRIYAILVLGGSVLTFIFGILTLVYTLSTT